MDIELRDLLVMKGSYSPKKSEGLGPFGKELIVGSFISKISAPLIFYFLAKLKILIIDLRLLQFYF